MCHSRVAIVRSVLFVRGRCTKRIRKLAHCATLCPMRALVTHSRDIGNIAAHSYYITYYTVCVSTIRIFFFLSTAFKSVIITIIIIMTTILKKKKTTRARARNLMKSRQCASDRGVRRIDRTDNNNKYTRAYNTILLYYRRRPPKVDSRHARPRRTVRRRHAPVVGAGFRPRDHRVFRPRGRKIFLYRSLIMAIVRTPGIRSTEMYRLLAPSLSVLHGERFQCS